MQNRFLWAVASFLSSVPIALAQQSNLPTPPAVLARSSGVADLLGPPEVPAASSAPAPAASCWNNPCGDPLRFWVNADYLLWWVKSGPVNTPLVTTGSPADPIPGALGQPNTQVLFGNNGMAYGPLSGVRLGAGIDLGANFGVEGNYFILTRGAVNYTAASNASGYPVIARPFFNNQFQSEDSLYTSTPSAAVGPFAGSTSVTSYTQLQGWELNLTSKHAIGSGWSGRLIGGFRSLNLNEDLVIRDSLTPLAPASLTFLGAGNFVNPPNMLSDLDRFHTSNTFYGGQIGGRLQWAGERFTFNILHKVAVGVNQQIATIDGSTTAIAPGVGSITAPGGVLALPTNMGHHYRSVFSVVPEIGLNAVWNITPNIKATIGYTVIFWSQVARPGNQIDRNINPALQPSNQNFGNGLGIAQPGFTFRETSFWAQGVNVGLQFRY